MNLFNYFTPKADTFYLQSDATIRQAIEKFDYHKFSVVPLIDKDGFYVSTISEGDILRYIKNEANFDINYAESVSLEEIERYRSYSACKSDASLTDIMQLALQQNFVPIVDDRGMYIGIIKRKTILNHLLEANAAEVK
ncbi:MAG: CBS domain-containing protein [Oscillospiraceae bacterium]|nr:CBS domain-containing protein [Oscillospiraceae bacterium]